MSSFVGRRRELAELAGLLATTRLLTVTGAGGSGKTRLALRLAQDLADAGRYPAGVCWVDLAPVGAGALVLPAVAAALNLREGSSQPLLPTVTNALGDVATLLILDNCEHVLAACAALVDACLRACPALVVLATSREPLALAGETVWRTPPLPLPAEPDFQKADGGHLLEIETAAQSEAVQLFVARAAASQPAFRLGAENAGAVVQICRRLDGLPLAIELAAPWVRMLSVGEITARLDRALVLLAHGPATAPPRHQTLRAAIEWSYALLSRAEKSLLKRLAVFAGGFTLEAAEAVCAGGDLPVDTLLATLASLLDKSLAAVASQDERSGLPTRYRLLETIRQYAWEKLAAGGEAPALRRRHFAWSLALVEAAAPQLRGPESPRWLARLAADHDNLRAALAWSLTAGSGEQTLRLAAALHEFWERRGHLSEGRAALQAALQQASAEGDAPAAPPALCGRALLAVAALSFDQGDWAAAAAAAQESATRLRQAGDQAGLTLALLRLGFAVGPASEAGVRWQAEALALAETLGTTAAERWVVAVVRFVAGQGAYFRGDYAPARAGLEEALRLMQEIGDLLFLPRILNTLAGVDLALGNYALALAGLQRSLALLGESGDLRSLALTHGSLGDAARCLGDYGQAEAAYQAGLALYRRLGNTADEGAMLHNLGYVALGRGDYTAASAFFGESLLRQHARDDAAGVAEGLAGLGALAAAQGQPARAAWLLGSVEAQRERQQAIVWPAERLEWKRALGALQGQLDASALAAAWTAGRAASVEQAVNYALSPAGAVDRLPAPARLRDQQPSSPAAQTRPPARVQGDGLTPREREVAALVAAGLSNRAIAEALVIAESTAERHIANILAKLGFHARSQIAAWAAGHGLAHSRADLHTPPLE